MSDFSKFLKIRKAYAEILPEWMAEYKSTGDMRQDPYFMDWEFTPIERNVWSDIRALGLPFYPQLPVLNYFLDFGCPFLKIGIECDGKAWHDYELDKERDARLADHGWMIFRIEGHECKRSIEPWIEFDGDDQAESIAKYFLSTSEGVMSAIKRRYFNARENDKYSNFVDATLFNHMSTPEINPARRAIRSPSNPVLMRDSLEGYIERIMLKARLAA